MEMINGSLFIQSRQIHLPDSARHPFPPGLRLRYGPESNAVMRAVLVTGDHQYDFVSRLSQARAFFVKDSDVGGVVNRGQVNDLCFTEQYVFLTTGTANSNSVDTND